jgi:hypothetical protein
MSIGSQTILRNSTYRQFSRSDLQNITLIAFLSEGGKEAHRS